MNNKLIISSAVIIIVLILGSYYVLQKNNTAQQTASSTSVNTSKTNSQTTVTLTTNGFSPAVLTIKAGTKVTWLNKSGQTATVNSNPHPTHTDYPPLNLGEFQDGGTLTLVFDKPGTYGYHNHLNPSQQGQIIVQ